MEFRKQILDNCRALFDMKVRLITYTRSPPNPLFPSKVHYHAIILPWDVEVNLKADGGRGLALLGPSKAITREGAIVSLLAETERMIGDMLLKHEGSEGEVGTEEGGVGGGEEQWEALLPGRPWTPSLTREEGEEGQGKTASILQSWRDRLSPPTIGGRNSPQQTQSVPSAKRVAKSPEEGTRRDRGVPKLNCSNMPERCMAVGGQVRLDIGSSRNPSADVPEAVDHPAAAPGQKAPGHSVSLDSKPPATSPSHLNLDLLENAIPSTTGAGDFTRSSYRSSGSETIHDEAAAEEGYDSETTFGTYGPIMTPRSITPVRSTGGAGLGPKQASDQDLSTMNRALVKNEVALAMKGLFKAMERQIESIPESPWGLFG